MHEQDLTPRFLRAYLARNSAHVVGDIVDRFHKSDDIHEDLAPIRATHAVNSLFPLASVAVEELRPKHLRGYGTLSGNDAHGIERLVDDLQGLVMGVRLIDAAGGEGGSSPAF